MNIRRPDHEGTVSENRWCGTRAQCLREKRLVAEGEDESTSRSDVDDHCAEEDMRKSKNPAT